jgi:AcrR family transcriptional regulator
MSHDAQWVNGSRQRGDRRREAILVATRQLLTDRPFSGLAVSTISARAGLSRSNFYFYFESKYAVLGALLNEAVEDLEQVTQSFAPRAEHETPATFVARMVAGAAAVYDRHWPVLSVCTLERNSDAGIRAVVDDHLDAVIAKIVATVEAEPTTETARPVSDDLPMLVRTLVVTPAFMLAGETAYLDADGDRRRCIRVLEEIWLAAVWPDRRERAAPQFSIDESIDTLAGVDP